jgi:hypothetical protein
VPIPVMTCLQARTDLIQPCKIVTIAQSSDSEVTSSHSSNIPLVFRLAFATANTGAQFSVSLMDVPVIFLKCLEYLLT